MAENKLLYKSDNDKIWKITYDDGSSEYVNTDTIKNAGGSTSRVIKSSSPSGAGMTYTAGSSSTPLFNKMTLNKDTGRVQISAPQSVLDRIQQAVDNNDGSIYQKIYDQAKQVSLAYNQDPNYKFQSAEDSNVTWTIDERLQQLNDLLNGTDETAGVIDYYNVVEDKKKDFGDKYKTTFSEDQIASYLANGQNLGGVEVDSSTRISVPKINDADGYNFFDKISQLETYDAASGTVEYGDFMENWYNREKTSGEDIVKVREYINGIKNKTSDRGDEELSEEDKDHLMKVLSLERTMATNSARASEIRKFADVISDVFLKIIPAGIQIGALEDADIVFKLFSTLPVSMAGLGGEKNQADVADWYNENIQSAEWLPGQSASRIAEKQTELLNRDALARGGTEYGEMGSVTEVLQSFSNIIAPELAKKVAKWAVSAVAAPFTGGGSLVAAAFLEVADAPDTLNDLRKVGGTVMETVETAEKFKDSSTTAKIVINYSEDVAKQLGKTAVKETVEEGTEAIAKGAAKEAVDWLAKGASKTAENAEDVGKAVSGLLVLANPATKTLIEGEETARQVANAYRKAVENMGTIQKAQNAINVALRSQKGQTLVNLYKFMTTPVKGTSTIAKTGEVLADIARAATKELFNSYRDTMKFDPVTYNKIWETGDRETINDLMIEISKDWASALAFRGAGKLIKGTDNLVKSTKPGKVAAAWASRNQHWVNAKVGSATTAIKNKFYGDYIQNMKSKVQKMQMAGVAQTKINKKQSKIAVAEANKILREAAKNIGDTSFKGAKNLDDLVKVADEIMEKQAKYARLQNSIDALKGSLKRNCNIILNDKTIKPSDEAILSSSDRIRKIERNLGWRRLGGETFSQETSNYIGLLQRKESVEGHINAIKELGNKATPGQMKALPEWEKDLEVTKKLLEDSPVNNSEALVSEAYNYHRKSQSFYENLRQFEFDAKLMSEKQFNDFNELGWGYAKSQRQVEFSSVVMSDTSGVRKVKDSLDFHGLKVGATGDFVDPNVVRMYEVNRVATVMARRDLFYSVLGATNSKVVTVASGEFMTSASRALSRESTFNKYLNDEIQAIAKEVDSQKYIDDAIENWVNNTRFKGDIKLKGLDLNRAQNKVEKEMAKSSVSAITDTARKKGVKNLLTDDEIAEFLDSKDLNLYNAIVQGKEDGVNNFLEYLGLKKQTTTVPTPTMTDEGIKTVNETTSVWNMGETAKEDFNETRKLIKQRIQNYNKTVMSETLEMDANSLSTLATYDQTFGNDLNRAIASDLAKNSDTLDPIIRERRAQESILKAQTVFNQEAAEYNNLVKQFKELTGVDYDFFGKNSLYPNIIESIDELYDYSFERFYRGMPINAITSLDELAKATGQNPEDLARALFFKNLSQGKNYEKVQDYVSKELKRQRNLYINQLGEKTKKAKEEAKKVAKSTGKKVKIDDTQYAKLNSIMNTLENNLNKAVKEEAIERYHQACSELNANRFIGEPLEGATALEKIADPFAEVEKYVKEIEGKAKNLPNYISIPDEFGNTQILEIDPLLGDLVKTNALGDTLGGVGAAFNSMSKLYRTGQTVMSFHSASLQLSKDLVGPWVVNGSLTKMFQNNVSELAGTLPNSTIDLIQSFDDPITRKRALEIVAEMEKGGKSIQEIKEALLKREINIGKIISPSATEAEAMKLSNEATRLAKYSGDKTTSRSFTKKIADGIDWLYDPSGGKLANGKAKKLLPTTWNSQRESLMRNISYKNAYASALEKGYTLGQARDIAEYIMNNATINFLRKTYHCQNLMKTVPYLAAAINGTKSWYRLFTLDPIGMTSRIMGGLVFPTMGLTFMALNDETSRETYNNIPEYTKNGNLIIVDGNDYYTVPMPEEYSWVLNPFRHMAEMMMEQNKHSALDFAISDALQVSPIDLSGFYDLDQTELGGTPTFASRIERGALKLGSQISPVIVKTGFMLKYGIDPYTGKSIDTSYVTYDDEGNAQVMDYTQNSFAKWLSKINVFGLGLSASSAAAIVKSLFGSATTDLLGAVTDIAAKVVGDEDIQGSIGGEVSSLNLASGYIGKLYKTENDRKWQEAYNTLEKRKEALINSKEYKDKIGALAEEDYKVKPEAKQKIRRELFEMRSEFNKNALTATQNLMSAQGGSITGKQFSALISLMSFPENTSSEAKSEARSQAIDTMLRLGFPQTGDGASVFGEYKTQSDGSVIFKRRTPLAILSMNYSTYNSSSVIKDNLKALIDTADPDIGKSLKDEYSDYKDLISAAYSEKDYDAVDAYKKQWNAKLITKIYPYIQEMTPSAVFNSPESKDEKSALEYLMEYIEVPSEFETNKYGRYVSLNKYGNKDQAYKEGYLRYIFNTPDIYGNY